MKPTHTIIKYANRRLYDTAFSRYTTLAEVRSLITREIPIRVIDKDSRRDLTDWTLVQMLLEQLQEGSCGLVRELVLEAIRLQSRGMSCGAADAAPVDTPVMGETAHS
jgi:polyhydroxyalkanoate synthesis repressor PhaR